jgi:hypothetical protein
VARGEVGEGGLAGEDLVAEVEEARGGVCAGGGGDDAAVRVLPGGPAAGAFVLDEDVRRAHRLPLRQRHGFALASSVGWRQFCKTEGVLALASAWEEIFLRLGIIIFLISIFLSNSSYKV